MVLDIHTNRFILDPGDFGIRKGKLDRIFYIDDMLEYRGNCILELGVYFKYSKYIDNMPAKQIFYNRFLRIQDRKYKCVMVKINFSKDFVIYYRCCGKYQED